MKCNMCNVDNSADSLFCSKCGNRLVAPEQPMQQPVQQPIQPQVVQAPSYQVGGNVQVKEGLFTNGQKAIIIGLLCLLLLLLGYLAFFKKGVKEQEATRTIMIYLEGSSLETDGEIATAELDSIDPSKIDFDKTNILVYTGGTSKWFNFIRNDENAIYKLTKDGYVKLESFPKKNMGDPATLAEFLNYSYDNYKTGHYNLILFNHGSGVLGAIIDDFTKDQLSLQDFQEAFTNSPFKGNNKLDTIIFRTCLNGTVEVASALKSYSKYLISSEEVTWGSKYTNVFGYFINELSPSDNGVEVGKKFIAAYNQNMKDIADINKKYTNREFNEVITYSIVDLSKIDKVTNEFEKYIKGIDASKNFSELSRIRTELYQFAATAEAYDYDTIDMYEFVDKTSGLSSNSADGFKKAFNEAVVYFSTNNDETHGLSIYFPYQGKKNSRAKIINIYKGFNFLRSYNKFISNFEDVRNGATKQSFSFASPNVTNKEEGTVEIQLTDEQANNYLSSTLFLFRRNKEHPNYYDIVYNTNDVTLTDDKKLKSTIGSNLITVEVDGKKERQYIPYIRYKNGDTFKNVISVMAINNKLEVTNKKWILSARLVLERINDKPALTDIEVVSRDNRLEAIKFSLDDFTTYDFMFTSVRLLDENNKLLPNEDWETTPNIEGVEFKQEEGKTLTELVDLQYAPMDKDGEWYMVFAINGINGETNLTDLIKVGE